MLHLGDVLERVRALQQSIDDLRNVAPTLQVIARDLPDIADSLRTLASFVKSPETTTPNKKHVLWIQPPDERDLRYSPPAIQKPGAFDLSSQLPVLDQGGLATCAACAVASAVRYLTGIMPSRLHLYWEARSLAAADTSDDVGTCIRDVCRVASKGVLDESAWPYDESAFDDPPPTDVVRPAGVRYMAVSQVENDIVTCIAEGHPVIFGTCVFPFAERETREPTLDDPMLGWSAAMLVGYDAVARSFKVQWSFGESYGVGGRTTVPYETILDSSLSTDFWTLRKM